MDGPLLSTVLAIAFLFQTTSIIGLPANKEAENPLAKGIERMVQGKMAKDGQFPYAVALFFRGRYTCTASLISRTTVLSAGHCVKDPQTMEEREPKDLYGIVGAVNHSSPHAKRLNFKKVIAHPDYNTPTFLANDLSLLLLNKPVRLTRKIKTICLAEPSLFNFLDIHPIAMGWGTTDASEDSLKLPQNLQYVDQFTSFQLYCTARYGEVFTQKNICTEGFFAGICEGDSGGPLVHYHGKNVIQLGVASYVDRSKCGVLFSPSVFVRVSEYVSWIHEASEDPKICSKQIFA